MLIEIKILCTIILFLDIVFNGFFTPRNKATDGELDYSKIVKLILANLIICIVVWNIPDLILQKPDIKGLIILIIITLTLFLKI